MSKSVNNRAEGRSGTEKHLQREKSGTKASGDKIKRSNSAASRTVKAKQSESSRFDTLDSAYSTCESSYNTVDSSYSQHTSSSGYNTLELRWKDAKLDRSWIDDEAKRHPCNNSSDVISRDLTPCGVNTEDIRFADDLDESGSTTETETDTEQTLLASSIDMSYVPDYVRPVAILPPSSAPLLSSNNSSLPSPSSSSSNSTLTVSSNKDEVSEMPRQPYRKAERNPPIAGYREDYLRKQKEKLCGRKSLDERLRSLESGAAVKLQVCKGSQSRRRKSVERDVAYSQRVHSNATTKSLVVAKDIDNSAKQDLQIEPTPTRAPPPDIIESHQPPNNVLPRPCEENAISRNYELLRGSDVVEEQDEITNYNKKTLEAKDCQCAKGNNSISDHKANPKNNFSNSIDTTLSESKTLKENGTDRGLSTSVEKLHTSEVKLTKLKWREPSQEALNKLHASQLAAQRQKPLDVASKRKDERPCDKPEPATETNRGALPPPLVVDVATDDRVVPVELRSPRGNGESRSDKQVKRKARVFVFPSSDSESDNLIKNQDEGNRLFHVAPVKFIPSVLRRSASKTPRDESSTPSSLTDDIAKTTIAKDLPTLSSSSQDTRLPPNDVTKQPTNTKRSKSSTHDRSSADKSRGARTRSSERQSTPPTSSRSASKTQESSSEKESRGRSERKPHRTPSRSRKSKTEYSELSDAKRPSHRHSTKLAEANLPSPRQQEVAHAVQFGVAGSNGEFPYIDDVTPSTDERMKPPPHDPRDRASSDGALLHDADSATLKRAFPLSRRGRSSKRKEGPRRISYMEAMESSEDLTPDPDAEVMPFGSARTTSAKEDSVPLGTYGRSNSADSVLSTADVTKKVKLRKDPRASSEDRGSLKKSHRRSYQIATNKPVDAVVNRYSPHKRQPSIRRLKSFFENNQNSPETQATEGRRRSRGRSLDPLPSLVLTECDGNIIREGFLYFKVATIEKGKRTSSQKSWKLVWVVLKDQSLYLCKDWTRNKSETTNENSLAVPPVLPPGSHSPPTPPSQLILEEEPLFIQGCLVSIAYNYVKRKNVFRLTTHNGSEYLLQADDRDDMLAWISCIQTRSSHDDKGEEVAINKDLILKKSSQIELGFLSARSPIFSRKSRLSPKPEKRAARKSRSPKPTRRPGVPIKDVDGSRRFKWRGSVNRIVKKFGQGQALMPGGTFDVHLEDCPPSASNEMVPFVVDLCCRIVEERGLNFTGIYRVPGNSGTLSALQEELNLKGVDTDYENDSRFCELNVVSSLLKSFFRKLPDPLFTNELYEDFIAMNRKKDPEERLHGLRRLIHMLPIPHYETLKFLITHLRQVADHSEVNKMEIRNLAIVFGPTLVRSTISDNMATMVTDMSDQCRIVESVLQHAEWFFSDEEHGAGDMVEKQPVPKEERHEPVPNIDHLLVNVGRTPGDNSDTTSESSKSKASNASEKDSFSRDVLELIFGAGKRWLNNNAQRPNKEEGDSSDDEFGFKQAERKPARASTEPPASPQKSPLTSRSTTTQKYQVAKPVASDIRAGWHKKTRQEISSSLYDYYLENFDRASRGDVVKPSCLTPSTDSSPRITSRTSSSLFNPPVQRNFAMQPRRSAGPQTGAAPHKPPSSTPKNARMFRSSEDVRSSSGDVSAPTHHHQENDDDTDSDTSVYVGETLEEKLKNLTNLEKKLERRPSRRLGNRRDVVIKVTNPADSLPPKAPNRKLTAPSQSAGERITPDNLHMYSGKKTTRELYRERKAQRQYQRDLVRARRNEAAVGIARCISDENGIGRCTSDDNVFKRSDPKRQMVRSNAHDDASRLKRAPSTGERVRRRHTLGGADFPDQDFWQNTQYTSLQNVSKDDPSSAVARLRPQVGSSTPLLRNIGLSNPKLCPSAAAIGNYKRPDKHKTESYI